LRPISVGKGEVQLLAEHRQVAEVAAVVGPTLAAEGVVVEGAATDRTVSKIARAGVVVGRGLK